MFVSKDAPEFNSGASNWTHFKPKVKVMKNKPFRPQAELQKGSRLYKIWSDMKSRTSNRKDKDYPRYGGRGIKVCRQWANFMPFARWALSNGYAPGLTIDRNDYDGMYEPGNCSWEDAKSQANNRSTNFMVTYKGKEKTLKNWCEELGLPYQTIYARIKRYNWPIEDAFEKPVK